MNDEMTIWKFPIFPPEGEGTEIEVEMPEGAEVLWVDIQESPNGKDLPWVWATVDPTAPLVARKFHVVATGAPFKRRRKRKVGMVSLKKGYPMLLVYHVFEEESSLS